MSDNWVVQNLQNALDTWNKYLSEIWQLITQSPEQFKGGSIWGVIVNIHDAFFVVGVMRTCGSFAEVKKPEHALKLFIRFAIAKGVVTYGLELMMALFNIVQGLVSTIMNAAGFGSAQQTVLPQEIIDAVESCGFFESIPLWAVTLIGGLFITVPSLHLRRGTDPKRGQEFYQELCRCLPGRCHHCAGLHYLFPICGVPACH